MKKILCILFLIFSISINSQTVNPSTEISIIVTDGTPTGKQELKIGLDPLASNSFDPIFGEEDLPPFPPAGAFEARILLPAGNYNGSESSRKDIRNADFPFSGQKEHRLQYQPGLSTTITIMWDLPPGISGNLKDIFSGNLINVQMYGTGMYTVLNPVQHKRLKLFVNYQNIIKSPYSFSPVNNSLVKGNFVKLKWKHDTPNINFHIEVSTDSAFINKVVNDSSLIDSSYIFTGFTERTNYFWRVRAKGNNLQSSFSDDLVVRTGIKNPDNLVAVSNSIKKVNLSWIDNSQIEQGFVIQRKNGDSLSTSAYSTISILPPNRSSFIDSVGISDTTKYTYRIFCFDAIDTSLSSNQAVVTTIIPVELSSFYILNKRNYIELSWTTSTETNNQGFEIEKRTNDSDWERIAFINGKGSSVLCNHYIYSDINVKYGNKYTYRLTQLDFDGTRNFCDQKEIYYIDEELKFNLFQNYPNPFNPTTIIPFTLKENSHTVLNIYNSLGELIDQIENAILEAGYYEYKWDSVNYGTGVYYYELMTEKNREVKKMIIIK